MAGRRVRATSRYHRAAAGLDNTKQLYISTAVQLANHMTKWNNHKVKGDEFTSFKTHKPLTDFKTHH